MIPAPETSLLPETGQDAAILWQHRALCQIALPIRTPRSPAWSREADEAGAFMGQEPAPAEQMPLPSGRFLRLLLLHVFTAALRGDSTSVEIGPDIESVAASLGLHLSPKLLREMAEQMERLIASRLRVADGRQAPISVLDARAGRTTRGAAAWRPVLRLTERFLSSLQRDAVALDRAAVAALVEAAPALDAYAWLAANLPGVDADRPVLVSWDSLQRRFGQATSPGAAFRTSFASSLEAVREVYPAARFAVGEDGVELQPSPRPVGRAALPQHPAAFSHPDVIPADSGAAAEALPPEPGVPSAAAELAPALDDAAGRADAMPDAVLEAVAPAQPASDGDGPEHALSDQDDDPRPHQPPELERAEPERAGPQSPRLLSDRDRNGGRIRLAPMLTGLEHSIWLRRGEEGEGATIEVTPGADYHLARRSLIILEPVVLQVVGQLRPRELDQVAAWVAANAELIQDYWDGTIASVFDVAPRVKQVPAMSRW